MSAKTWLVLRHELIITLTRPSFILAALGLPLIAGLIFGAASWLAPDTPAGAVGTAAPSAAPGLKREGFVDYAGIIHELPPDLAQGMLSEYPDEDAALAALRAGEISAYYVIAADYIDSGELTYTNPAYTLVGTGDQSWLMKQVLTANLLEGDRARLERFWNPMNLEQRPLQADERRDMASPLAFYVPYVTMMLLYATIMMAGSLLMNGITTEKQNRVLEILLGSVHPRELLAGKVAALGIAGLVQTFCWVGAGYVLLRLAGQRISLPADLQLSPSIIGWGLAFFALGYAVYATLMAGLGALAPSLKEASQGVTLVIWPLIVPLLFIWAMAEQPHAPYTVALSLFPLTSPTVMVLRLSLGGVPLWQPLLALALLALTAVLVLRAVARLFRAQVLLGAQGAITPKVLVRALAGKE